MNVNQKLNRKQIAELNKIPGVSNVKATSLEIYVEGHDRLETLEKTEALKEQVQKIVLWGGFQKGCGTWVLKKDYTFDSVDACDKSNQIHF